MNVEKWITYAVSAVALVMAGIVAIAGPSDSAMPMTLAMGGFALAGGRNIVSGVQAKKQST